MTVAADELDRIVTVPNVLTVGRIALLVGFCLLLFFWNERIPADLLLAATGVTDFLDGYVARRFNQVSKLGKILDPTADRIVLTTAILSITVYGAVPGWFTGVVLAREVGVSLAVLALIALGSPPLEVSWLGKAGTFGMLIAFPLFLLGDGVGTADRVVRVVAWVLALPAVAASFAAVAGYAPAALSALRTRREGDGRVEPTESGSTGRASV